MGTLPCVVDDRFEDDCYPASLHQTTKCRQPKKQKRLDVTLPSAYLSPFIPTFYFTASKYCNVSSKTIINWVEAGHIKAYRTVGGHRRIKKSDLETFMR
ncbi:MAG: helix-turn-helix domain-containing protein, partial [Desulfosalsimonadaceae bacterium]